MTYNQQKQHDKLRKAVVNAYKKWDVNADKSKDQALHDKWLKAMEKCEAFEDKYF